MPKKPGLSFERHQEIGPELKHINERLRQISTELSAAYPFSGELSRPYKNLRAAVNAVSDARAHLEHNYFKEHRGKAHFETYYAGQDPGPILREKYGKDK